ncbi:hypothetical protein [Roseimaritima sediminicola]|uniref:hypothetical protein n=1 Tax=Roseimaritima sediminicola TaxID=2662066 RepID=UPI0012985334|nr:hypothetical protein [Roseimaritima sediminicola]
MFPAAKRCKERPALLRRGPALLRRSPARSLAAVLLVAAATSPLAAQSPVANSLRAVPKFGEQAPAAAPQPRSAAWNLAWRKSGQTTPPPAPQTPAAHTAPAPGPASNQAASNQAGSNNVAASHGLAPAARAVPVRRLADLTEVAMQRPVRQTTFSAATRSEAAHAVRPAAFQNQDQNQGGDPSLELPPSLQPVPTPEDNNDIFGEPPVFPPGGAMQSPLQPPANPSPALPDGLNPADPTMPRGTDDAVEVPGTMPQLDLPGGDEADELPSPANPMREPASPNDRGSVPMQPGADTEPAPETQDYPNPFDRSGTDRDSAADDSRRSGFGEADIAPPKPQSFSCEAFRDRIDARTIEKISLDISPPFQPAELDPDVLEKSRREFRERQEVRQWRSLDGFVMAEGRLHDLAYEKVVIQAEHGGLEEISLHRVSEADLAYITEQWGLPNECRIRQAKHQPRRWTPQQVTWKASGLCHKPLYFEDVNLERYGHTAGPIAQPLLSTAHFFTNIAVLPYKMGIHPPNECQYTLGYYRPGSCAPWVVPPVPISLRGALAQGAVMGGFVGLVP